MDKKSFVQSVLIRLIPADDKINDAISKAETMWDILTARGYGNEVSRAAPVIHGDAATGLKPGVYVGADVQPAAYVPFKTKPELTKHELMRHAYLDFEHWTRMYARNPAADTLAALNQSRIALGLNPLPEPEPEPEPETEEP